MILVGIFALIDRLRKRHVPEVAGGFLPRVAVLIPAYNEEKVIVRTIRSVLNSDYPHLRIIVIDDGSTDRTSEVAREAYPEEIAAGMLTVLRKPQWGQGGGAELRGCRSGRRVLRRHRRRYGDRAGCGIQAGLPFRRSAGRRGGGQRQGGQSGQPVDALAGARVHHQPELRAPRVGPVRCGHGGSRRDWRLAHGGGAAMAAATRSIPSPRTPT